MVRMNSLGTLLPVVALILCLCPSGCVADDHCRLESAVDADHSNLAVAFEDVGNWHCALQHRKRDAEIYNDLDAHYNLAFAFEKNGREDEAHASLKDALRLDPTDLDVQSKLEQRKGLSLNRPQLLKEIRDMFAGWSQDGSIYDAAKVNQQEQAN